MCVTEDIIFYLNVQSATPAIRPEISSGTPGGPSRIPLGRSHGLIIYVSVLLLYLSMCVLFLNMYV